MFSESQSYANSKLANALNGNELARRMKEHGVTVVTYDLGLIGNTGMLKSFGWLQPLLKWYVEASIDLTAY
jgi:NAD(P)-dependent dehydrogenase (short-subunit alcohol dehydrogenase family)